MQRCLDRRMAEIVFDLGRVRQFATNDQPAFCRGQVAAGFGHVQECKFRYDGTLAALFAHGSDPIGLGDLRRQLFDGQGCSPGSLRRQLVGGRPRPGNAGTCTFGGVHQIRVFPLLAVKYHLPKAAKPSRNAGASPQTEHRPPPRQRATFLVFWLFPTIPARFPTSF